jgi:hypothetical protein
MDHILSEMKTFTVRELHRRPSVVLDSADQEREVRIRRRDGRVYALRPVEDDAGQITAVPDLRARRASIFGVTAPAKHVRMLDQLIAGELR